MLRSEDSGYVWQGCAIPPGAEHLDFRAIQAFDENTALVMSSGPGDRSRLYKTTDGCRTWKLVFTNPDKDGFWDAFVARRTDIDPNNICAGDSRFLTGAIFGDPAVHKSNQSDTTALESFYLGKFTVGITCPQQSLAPSASNVFSTLPGEGAFAASNSVLLELGPEVHWLAVRQRLIQYTTGFTTPHHYQASGECDIAVPLGSESNSSGTFSIALRPESVKLPKAIKLSAGFSSKRPSCIGGDLVAVGGDYKRPNVAQRTAAFTAGTNIFRPAQTPPHGYRSSVAYDPTAKAWITVGPNGTDVSTDDGRNWRPLTPGLEDQPGADRDWNALSLPFVVGPHGRIGKLRPSALAATTPTKTPAKPRP